MRNFADEQEGWCQGTRNVMRAHRIVPSVRGIVESNEMYSSADMMDGSEKKKQKAKTHHTE